MNAWQLLRPDGSTCQLLLERPRGFTGRLFGLIGRQPPGEAQGMWLEPCRAVHTLAMRVPIDLVFLDRQCRVVKVIAALAPWRAAVCRAAFSVVEMRAGEAASLQVQPGALIVPAGRAANVQERTRSVCPSTQEETAMAKPPRMPKTAPAQGRRTRAAAAVAAVSLASGCAGPGTPVDPADAAAIGALPAVSAPAEVPLAASMPVAEAPPLAAPRPDPDPVQRASLASAETLYRDGRFDEALRAFRSVVQVAPANAQGWLRIGNVLHRRRDWFDALSAYRKAARPQADPAIREKAVYNIALLNLELARQALRRYQRIHAERVARAAGGGGSQPVDRRAAKLLSDEIGAAYRSLAAGGRHAGASNPDEAPASPRGGTPARSAVEVPARASDRARQVEIRQGGATR